MSKMREDESNEAEQAERHFDRWQYDFLKKCSERGDEGIKEWNEWRENNPSQDICLDDQDFDGWYLKEANFKRGTVFFTKTRRQIEYSGQVYLRNASFKGADVRGANFWNAHLEYTRWEYTVAQDAHFHSAHVDKAQLDVSEFDNCDFSDAVLRDATLTASSIRAAKFLNSALQGCSARSAVVDGVTVLWECHLDRTTDFTGVALGSMRIDPATRQLLEYNMRRMNWERWYVQKKPEVGSWLDGKRVERRARKARQVGRLILTLPLRWFWSVSDYGLRTWRIIAWFFGLAIAFAFVYWLWPDCVIVCGKAADIRGFLHALYFSVVTMTTLGFGDIAANPDSWFGQLLLMIQVIMGYVLLGALVTRFAVLFTAGGPAGKFAESERK